MTTSTRVALVLHELDARVSFFGRVDHASVSEVVQDPDMSFRVTANLYRAGELSALYEETFNTRDDAYDFRQCALEIVERST